MVRLTPGPGDSETTRSGDRGQLVLVAAGLIAVALVPMAMAYLQLGYHADVRAGGDYADPGYNAERFLSRAVHEAGDVRQPWARRDAVVTTVRDRLEGRLRTLEGSQVDRGIAYAVSYNRSAASEWAADECPGGPDRQFGPCEPRRGVVVQRRDGETHVLAVGLDVVVTTDRGTTEFTLVVRTVGGP